MGLTDEKALRIAAEDSWQSEVVETGMAEMTVRRLKGVPIRNGEFNDFEDKEDRIKTKIEEWMGRIKGGEKS